MPSGVAKIASASRICTSEPRFQQRHFPVRRKAIREIASTNSTTSRRQQTLTQLEFFDNLEDREQSSADDDVSDEWVSPRPTKRHRANPRHNPESHHTLRQTTLTQMDALLQGAADSDHEAFEIAVDVDHADAEHVDDDMQGSEPTTRTCHTHSCNAACGSSIGSPCRVKTEQSPHQILCPSRIEPSTPVSARLHQPRRSVIPSSQSPAESPFSADGEHSTDIAGDTRGPLREIHPNILAMRDELALNSLKSGQCQGPSQRNPGPDDEEGDCSNENFEPTVGEKRKTGALKRKQPATHYQPIASPLSRAPSSASSDGTADESPPGTPFLRSSFRTAQPSYELPRSSPITAMGSSPPTRVDGESPFKKPALPRKALALHQSRDSHSPTHPHQESCISSPRNGMGTHGEQQSHDLNDTGDIITASQILSSSAPES